MDPGSHRPGRNSQRKIAIIPSHTENTIQSSLRAATLPLTPAVLSDAYGGQVAHEDQPHAPCTQRDIEGVAQRGAQSDGEVQKGRRKSRMGSPNFSEADIEVLLQAVEDHEPIGNNEWARVASIFNTYAMLENRPQRDITAIRGKFDRLANTKKPTGDPSCPPAVRRAKLIAREILGKVNAFSVGDEDLETDEQSAREEEGEGHLSGSQGNRKRACGDAVGMRKRQRRAGKGGVKSLRSSTEDDDMLEHMGVMAQSVSSLVQVFQKDSDGVSDSLQSAIRDTVKEEVREELQ